MALCLLIIALVLLHFSGNGLMVFLVGGGSLGGPGGKGFFAPVKANSLSGIRIRSAGGRGLSTVLLDSLSNDRVRGALGPP